MDNPFPKVVACLPSFNGEAFITKTIECLKKQTYPNFAVLISDDCSTDNTVPFIKSNIQDDKRFLLIEQEKNLGWVDNINFLVEKAVDTAEYVFIMPHDDQIEPDYIQKLTTSLEKNPSAILAFSDMECAYLNQKKLTLRYDQIDSCTNRKDQLSLLLKFEGYWWTAYRGITRSSALKKIIPLEKNWVGTKDYALDWIWLVKLSLCGEFVRVPETLYSKYYQQTSTSLQWKHSNRDVANTYLTCSLMLWKWNLTLKEKIRLQLILYVFLLKRILIDNKYSLLNVLKHGWGKLKKIFIQSETAYYEKTDR
ncbi:MAG: glycosyltransferase [Bacteroidetes bacterium]|jgi:glycosyltransferase involved in cell wall biosynthesis|nr:glycosyltransferase [Bacteroidota bacterium]